jgi:membrane protease YdiL (CAAX protease family)
VVFAPLFEEALFRGFVYEGFARSRAGVAGAIILTSIGWAALHFYYAGFEMATIFVLGLVLGVVRWKEWVRSCRY